MDPTGSRDTRKTRTFVDEDPGDEDATRTWTTPRTRAGTESPPPETDSVPFPPPPLEFPDRRHERNRRPHPGSTGRPPGPVHPPIENWELLCVALFAVPLSLLLWGLVLDPPTLTGEAFPPDLSAWHRQHSGRLLATQLILAPLMVLGWIWLRVNRSTRC